MNKEVVQDLDTWEKSLSGQEELLNQVELSQDEIDALMGLQAEDKTQKLVEHKGIRALIENSMKSYEKLPMLEILLARFVRSLSSSMRNFTSDNVDVEVQSISSMRFNNFMNSISLPASLVIFKIKEWDSLGLMVMEQKLIFSIVDTLFGGRKNNSKACTEFRPYTSIEQAMIRQVSELIFTDLGAAFDFISPSTMLFERVESNPQFANIAKTEDACVLIKLYIKMEGKGGAVDIVFPYSAIEPIKDLLTHVVIGENFGKDASWNDLLEQEVYNVPLTAEVTFKNMPSLTLNDVANFKPGSVLLSESCADDDVVVSCDTTELFTGKLGRYNGKLAVHVSEVLHRNK